jgi:hypothetical protein
MNKRIILIFVLFFCFGCFIFGGPEKIFEIGAEGAIGFANNHFSLADYKAGTLTLDLNTISQKDFYASLDQGFKVHFDLFCFRPVTLGIFFGMGEFDNIFVPQDILEFLVNSGSALNFSGTAQYSRDVFMELGFRIGRKQKKWSFDVYPAFYVPQYYTPNADIDLSINSGNSLSITGTARIPTYTALTIKNDAWVFDAESFTALGFDASMQAELHCLSNLDIGAKIDHFPLVPAHTSRATVYSVDFSIVNLDVLDPDSINSIKFEEPTYYYYPHMNFLVFRPLRIDAWASWGFWENQLRLKPTVGFSALTTYGYEKVLFNASLELSLKKPEFIRYYLSTGYREKIWQHTLGVEAAVWDFDINFALLFQSQEFVQTFLGKGLKAWLGVSWKY